MAVDDLACDGQAETGASGLRRSGFVETGEPLEDSLGVRFGDSWSVVCDGEHGFACLLDQRDCYLFSGVTLCVLEDIADRPAELNRISIDMGA